MPEMEGERRELIGGEVVTLSFAKLRHELVKSNVNQILAAWLAQHRIARLFPETLYVLDEHNSFIPDRSIVFPGRFEAETDWIQGAPEIDASHTLEDPVLPGFRTPVSAIFEGI